MATALIVTITAFKWDSENGYYSCDPSSITSETLTFVDVKPAEKALAAICDTYPQCQYEVKGTILKDVVI